MAEAFLQQGHQVTLICRARSSQGVPATLSDFYGTGVQIPCETIPWETSRTFDSLSYVIRGVARVSGIRPDLIVSRNLIASFLLSLLGAKVLHESHSAEESYGVLGPSLLRGLSRLPGLVGVVAITQNLAQRLERQHPRFSGRILIAPDGARFPNKVVESVPNSPPRIGYVGNLYAGRGIELILDLAKNCHWLDFEVVGSVDRTDTKMLSIIGNAPRNLKFTGFVTPSKASNLLRSFDILLAPYQAETMDAKGNDTTKWMSPLKIFEYMASGVPMIASDLPVLREVLSHGVNALVADPRDTSGWIAAIDQLCSDVGLRRRLAKRAQEDIETKYAWSLRAQNILQFFTKMVARSESSENHI